MAKATSNAIINEHLCEMMERLLDDELFQDKGKAKIEIERARALNSMVGASINLQQVEINKKKLVIDAMDVAGKWHLKESDFKTAIGIENDAEGTVQ